MAKEALFNILFNQYDFSELNVLDLFSGTGSIAYEFYSRECQSVTSVDQNIHCVKYIRSTKDALKMDTLDVVQANCFNFLEKAWKKYDIIFADPPYDMPDFDKIVKLVFERKLLSEEGVLIIEHSKNTHLNSFPEYVSTRKYGSVHFSFFENQE
jgi:16S rRNA (guanine(966)-N(2))-methyltransferase RsmD